VVVVVVVVVDSKTRHMPDCQCIIVTPVAIVVVICN